MPKTLGNHVLKLVVLRLIVDLRSIRFFVHDLLRQAALGSRIVQPNILATNPIGQAKIHALSQHPYSSTGLA